MKHLRCFGSHALGWLGEAAYFCHLWWLYRWSMHMSSRLDHDDCGVWRNVRDVPLNKPSPANPGDQK